MSRTRTTPGRRVESDVIDIGKHEFESDEILPDLKVAYEAYGEFSRQNAVFVCHDLTGSQHVADHDTKSGVSERVRAWQGNIVGPGKAIDTSDCYVICMNVPGSRYGTDGPASKGPDDEPWGTDFLPITAHDWTCAQRRLLDHLDVDRLHTAVSSSAGDMSVLDWAMQFPDDVERLTVVASATRLDSQCLGIGTVARRIITSDPNRNGGDYYGEERLSPDVGLGLTRQLGHLMCLSKDSMERRFGRCSASRGEHDDALPSDPAAFLFPYREVKSYLDYQAEKFAERFSTNAYLYLMRAMDDFDLSEGYESDAAAPTTFEDEALLVSLTGDWHFTTEQSESLASAFRRGNIPVAHHVVESDHGHDAFLVEPEKVGPPLTDFVDKGVASHTVTDATPDGSEPSGDKDFAPVHSPLFSR